MAAASQEPTPVDSLTEQLASLLPQPKADSRLVLYVTEDMKKLFNGHLDSVLKDYPKTPKNVAYQIAAFVLVNHWGEVKDLVTRWNDGEVLSLTYRPQDGDQHPQPDREGNKE